VETSNGPSGETMYKLLHEYEVFISYISIAGARYLTHLSIGLAGSIDSFYVGEKSLVRRARIWVGISWRFYRQWVPIWRKVRRQANRQEDSEK
jgi:hypothetical protein